MNKPDTEEQIRREKKAIELFVNVFGGSFQKLDPSDVDFKIFDKNKKLIAYAEVKSRIRTIRDAYPLSIDLGKLSKLFYKRIPSVIIWSCDDGIIYARAEKITGQVMFNSGDMTVLYEKQKHMKYVRFT